MYRIKTDPHTHTLLSGHAFGTVEENARHAADTGMEAFALTDHFGLGGKLSDPYYFGPNNTLKALPGIMHGVTVLKGVEIDIVDFSGNLAGYDTATGFSSKTISEFILDESEYTIASLHYFDGCEDGTAAQYTEMYCKAALNPGVDVIGHCDRRGIRFDLDEVLKTAKQTGTLIEINEHSLDFGNESFVTCKKTALRCAELGVNIVVSSDAHSSFYVGKFPNSISVLEEISFPEELIANLTLERLRSRMTKKIKNTYS